MSTALAPMIRTMARSCGTVAAISLLIGGGALAQTAAPGVADAKVRTANSEWRRLSQNEVNCVDKSLRAKRSAVWFLIQRGIAPTDASVAGIRAGCRAQVARAPEAPAPAGELAAALAASDKAALDTAADKAAAEKVAADKAVSEKVVADKAATDKALAEKLERAVAEKAAAEKAAMDKVAAEKAAIEKVAADKAAAERAAAVRAAGDKVALNTSAIDKTVPVQAVPEKTVEDRAAVGRVKTDAESATAEAVRMQAEAERARKDAEKVIADVGFALAAAKSKISFVYGLIGGLLLVGFGAVAFVVMRKRMESAQSKTASLETVYRGTQSEFDRLVAAVLDEQKRRDKAPPRQAVASNEQRVRGARARLITVQAWPRSPRGRNGGTDRPA